MLRLRFIEKLKAEAYKSRWTQPYQTPTWKDAILEAIFQPKPYEIPGKGPMDMLHPDLKKLHLPHGMYMADWRKYKVEDHPELVEFQRRLKLQGLHDPWLRNYAFRFYPNMRTHRSVTAVVLEGCATGFVIAIPIYLLGKLLF